MTRALVDVQSDLAELFPLVQALTQYLHLRCAAADPNPSGHSTHGQRSDPKKAGRPVVSGDAIPTLIADAEYSVKEASALTRRPEISLRKMIKDGRLPSRKEEKTRRRTIFGKDLAHLMTQPTTLEQSASSEN